MARIPLERLYHANVVVEDLRASACSYARILGIARWDVHHWTPQRLTDSQAYGYHTQFGYATATGSNPHGVTFRLVQPTHGFSTYTEFLIARGQGVHSICVTRVGAAEMPVAQSSTRDDGSSSVLLDTRAALGGYCIEVETEASAPDEVWDLSPEATLPSDVRWLAEIPKIGHFGVAVSHLMDRLPSYVSVLGIEHWNAAHFHGAPGPLERSTVDGQTVDNAWLLAITDVADFGLELLQSTREPTDYRRTIERSGEGIHHVLVRRGLSEAEWRALRDWMEWMGIGVVMSGRLSAADFFYLDTRAALGFLLEVIVTRDVPDAATTSSPDWRFALDFSSKVTPDDA